MTRITQQQLESYLWGAAVLLRGTIDAGDYKQFIFPLLFYKRLCDVFDEETITALRESGGDQDFALFPENHRFQVPADAHWREVRKVNRNVGRTLQQAMRAIEVANQDKLMGIFGDAQWTNKDRLSDAMLRDLVEHFSALELTVANLPEDELGQGYEYLIKRFADDSGHTAAEFYTNRTVVHLMAEMLDVQPGESVYDPTCGSGGMLLSCIAHLRRVGKEWRNVKLYGQERNLMTSSIARMNCFLHGIEDFRIERGDTLAEPKLVEGDRLQRFDVVLANPPYSIKQWNREAFAADPWGRNIFGVPPQGRADYAFQQHILQSLKAKSGRCAVLWPHGILFRQEEAEMRRKLIEADLIECVLGLGPNLFYNSPMEACVVVCRTQKPKDRRGKILFINAVNEVSRERGQSFLTDEHLLRVVRAYQAFKDEPGFARAATLEQIRSKDGNLSIPLYVDSQTTAQRDEAYDSAATALPVALAGWLNSSREVYSSLVALDDSPPRPLPSVPNSLTPNAAWASLPLFDRTGWRSMEFGKFAESIGERVEPRDAQEETYVGLEHLDPQCLHIQRWGKGSDVTGTKLRFWKGDIIFGRRRAYQRKLAVAEFDGICSAHALVVRAKPGKVLPEFLPFLMMSDRFMNRAVEISVGSLSPTINWKTLRVEEFDLPPLDQQRRIAETLWAVDEALNRYSETQETIARCTDAARNEHFTSSKHSSSLVPVRETGRWVSGNTPSRGRNEYWSGSFPWVSPKDMKVPLIGDAQEHLSDEGRKEATVVGAGSLLIVIRGMILAHSFPLGITTRDVAFNQDMKALVPSEPHSVEYVFHWFRWAQGKILSFISDSSHGTKRLAMEDLFSMKIPKPSRKEQSRFVESIQVFESTSSLVRQTAQNLTSLRVALLNQAFPAK